MSSTGNHPALTTLTDLVYPGVRWDDNEYAAVQARLDIYDDFIVMTRYRGGQATQQYIVDPTEVAMTLSGINLSSGLLPPNTLFWGRQTGGDRLAIYLPPRIWPVTVRYGKEVTSGRAWQVPLPGLIMVGQHYSYTLWAVAEPPPFGPDTPLYVAPVPNVSGQEGVCRGNAPFPQASPATMHQAVDAFFQSRFNHDLGQAKSKKHPLRVLDHWYELDQAGAETYPPDDLVTTTLTLKGLYRA